jgi:hypothetical protein
MDAVAEDQSVETDQTADAAVACQGDADKKPSPKALSSDRSVGTDQKADTPAPTERGTDKRISAAAPPGDQSVKTDQETGAAAQPDEAFSSAVQASTGKNITNGELREQLYVAKLMENSLLKFQVAKLEKNLSKASVQIRNKVEFELLKEHGMAQTKLQEAQEFELQVSRAARKLEAGRRAFDAEREKFNKHLAISSEDMTRKDISADFKDLQVEFPEVDVDELMFTEVVRQVTRITTSTEQYKVYAKAEVAKALADHKAASESKLADDRADLGTQSKVLEQREQVCNELLQSLRKLDFEDTEARQRILEQGNTGRMASEEPKYALSDPRMESLLVHKYLAGYIDANMAIEYRNALFDNYDVDKQKYAYLSDSKDSRHPYQRGKVIGHEFIWRVICKELGRPDWDTSLDQREWSVTDFWPMTHDYLSKSIFGGIMAGAQEAEKRFFDRQAKEQEPVPEANIEHAGNKKTGSQASQKPVAETEKPNQRPANPGEASAGGRCGISS